MATCEAKRRMEGLVRLAACGALLAGVGGSGALPTDRPAPAAPAGGQTLGFAISYFYHSLPVADISEDCPTGLATGPDPADYFPPEKAKAIASNPQGMRAWVRSRGPDGQDVCDKPWLEPDTRMPVGMSRRHWGLDLDGGKHPPGCAAWDMTAPDGISGVDNQVSRLYACVGQRRADGYLPPYNVTLMRDGEYTLLLQVAGVDSLENDDEVQVTFLQSHDVLTKRPGAPNPAPSDRGILQHLSFTAAPENQNVARGRISNGVLTTEPKYMEVTHGAGRKPWKFNAARFRLAFMPHGGLKGVMGAYFDVEAFYDPVRRQGESATGPFNCTAMYNAILALADANPDPKTGRCSWISAAYTVEAEPAFILPARQRAGNGSEPGAGGG